MAGGAGGVGEGLQFTLFFLFGLFGGAHFEELGDGARDAAFFAEDRDFEEAGVDGAGEVGDLFQLCELASSSHRCVASEIEGTHQGVGLSNLIRRLLQPPLRRIDPPITLINVLLHIPHVVILKPMLALIRGTFIFRLQRLAVDFGTRTQVLLGVCEEVVWTGACEEGAADFGVGDGELGVA